MNFNNIEQGKNIVDDNDKFQKDLEFAEQFEINVCQWLNSLNNDCGWQKIQGKFKPYDLYCLMHSHKIECKLDTIFGTTKNYCIEVDMLQITEAEYFAYGTANNGLISDFFQLFHMKTIKEYMRYKWARNELRIIQRKDASRTQIMLISKDTFEKEFDMRKNCKWINVNNTKTSPFISW